MSCETVIGSIVALLDGELQAGERAAVEAHVAQCAACRAEMRAVQATRELVSQGLRSAGAGVARTSFGDLWARIEQDAAPAAPGRAHLRSAGRPGAPRLRVGQGRRGLWIGAGGLALAASLALMLVGLPPDRTAGLAPAPPERRAAVEPPPESGATGPKPAPRVLAGKPAAASSRAAPEVVARQEEAPVAATGALVAVNEIDPPRELLERPDLFLNYPIVRKLDELQHLEAVLAESPSGGSAG